MDDSYMIKTIKVGDAHYFEYLVRSYEDRIYGFIYHMVRNRDIAEDLTQDTFMRVFENMYKFNPDYPIKPWLFKIAYNVTVNHIKKNKKLKNEVKLDEDIMESRDERDYIQDFETRYIVLNEIESLKPDCRAIFLLRILEDLSFDQIAIMLGTSTASVKLKFYRNRRNFIDRLSKSFKEV